MKDIIHARRRRFIHTFSIIMAMVLAWGLLCSLPAKGQIMQSKKDGDLQPLIGRLINVSVDKIRYNPGGTIQVSYNCSRCSCPCDNPHTDEVYLHKSNIGADQMGAWLILGSLRPGATRGTLSFRIPATIQTAMNYVVTIWNSNRCWGRSRTFQVMTPPRVLLHQVTRPRPREVLYFGQNLLIRWISQRNWSDYSGVSLLTSDGNTIRLGNSRGNTLSWRVGLHRSRNVTLGDGDGYRIQVRESSGRSRTISSGPFSMHTPVFRIRVTNRTSPGTIIRRGNHIRIRWSNEPSLPASTRYKLYITWGRISPSIPGGTHFMLTTDRHDVSWRIPEDYAPGTPTGFPHADVGRFTCRVEVRLEGIEFARGESHRFDIEE